MNENMLINLCRAIRYDILTMTTRAGSGHLTSSLSAVELMTTLFFKYVRYDLTSPENPNNDRVIFSKGHASPLFYALYHRAGAISDSDLEGYRTFNSVLEGHPTKRFPFTEAATGSLGQGLSIGLGQALVTKSRVFVLSGDGELSEGSVWEALAAASFLKRNNLYFIIDVNRLGQSDPTMYAHNLETYKKRFEAFGWHTVTIENGNSLTDVAQGFTLALEPRSGPTVILAKTIKGAGISFLEDQPGMHGIALSSDKYDLAIKELGDIEISIKGTLQKPQEYTNQQIPTLPQKIMQTYNSIEKTSTRKAFGNALARLGSNNTTFAVIDGDVKNSTYTEIFAKEHPARFFELFIAEQNMVGVAVGISARGLHPVVSTFSCFLPRAFDQLRMATISGSNILINGSHAGVSIGADGPSQMGLEDLAMFRTLFGSTVLYPSDAIATERLTELALAQKGIVYIRTSRPETPIYYNENTEFHIGGSHIFSPSEKDIATIITAGVTLAEALIAQKELAKNNIYVRVMDAYSIKPIDREALKKHAAETQFFVIVEDHYPEGGLGDAVRTELSTTNIPMYHLAVSKQPRSGKPEELLEYVGINAKSIIETVYTNKK